MQVVSYGCEKESSHTPFISLSPQPNFWRASVGRAPSFCLLGTCPSPILPPCRAEHTNAGRPRLPIGGGGRIVPAAPGRAKKTIARSASPLLYPEHKQSATAWAALCTLSASFSGAAPVAVGAYVRDLALAGLHKMLQLIFKGQIVGLLQCAAHRCRHCLPRPPGGPLPGRLRLFDRKVDPPLRVDGDQLDFDFLPLGQILLMSST